MVLKDFHFSFIGKEGRKETNTFLVCGIQNKGGEKKNKRTKNLKVVRKTLNIDVINFCEAGATMII